MSSRCYPRISQIDSHFHLSYAHFKFRGFRGSDRVVLQKFQSSMLELHKHSHTNSHQLQAEMCALLLAARADPNKKDGYGLAPRHL